MDRSLAGRSPFGRLSRPLAPAFPGRGGRSPERRGGARRSARYAPARRWRSVSRLGALAGDWLELVRRRRRLRIALLACLVSLPLLAGGWLWLRQSPLVSVQRVRVSGVHGPEARLIESALTNTAHGMTTLEVNVGALRAAVAPFRIVQDLRVTPSFPHGLSIAVTEQLPVAALTVAGVRTAVATDGVVLGPALLSSELPTLTGASLPATGSRLADRSLLGALTVLGAAPTPFARAVVRVYTGPDGLTVAMRNGLLAYFGDAARPHAKWLSLARVLSDASSAGASYVDVRLPERPAAGFPAGRAPVSASATGVSAPEHILASEATVADLAARLAEASGSSGSTGREAASATATQPGSATPSEAASSSEATSSTSSETTSTPAAESPSSGAAP
jgi:cell division protein FtsQ